ncbi:helix-turn-helix domain-containing protein [Streptomyces armeniacus]|nr:helix-turn-helix transcriptional regulator [Streptomyces armeniacus]
MAQQQQDDAGSGTLKYFGSQMKLFRGRAGMSRDELGDRLGYSGYTVASVEQGRRVPQQEFVEQADELLGANGVLRAGIPFLLEARFPSWFVDFALLEADAVSMHSYENHVLPGLLQTEAYARAVHAGYCPTLDDEQVEQRVTARLSRQAVLERKPTPTLGFVIEETVLRRPIGGAAVLQEQLRRLLDCQRMRHVTVQIMPLNRQTHSGLNGPMVLLETPERKNLVYIEAQSGSFVISDREEVSALTQRYGMLRAQALTPEESVRFVEQLAGEL